MGKTTQIMDDLMKELVCTTLTNGSKQPILGYSPIFTSTKGTCLELALTAGYRQIVLGLDPTNDKQIGTIVKEWYRAGKVTRDDLFLALKIDVSKIQKVTTNISQRIHDLSCGYIDAVILSVGEKESTESLLSKWKTLEQLVQTGYTRGLGLSGPSPDVKDMEAIITHCSVKPALLLVEVCTKGALSKLGHLQKYTKYRSMTLLIVVPLDRLSEQIHGGLKCFSSYVNKYNRSPSQILVRYFLQKGLVVICESGEPQTTSNSFRVLDFLLDGTDMKNIGKILT